MSDQEKRAEEAREAVLDVLYQFQRGAIGHAAVEAKLDEALAAARAEGEAAMREKMGCGHAKADEEQLEGREGADYRISYCRVCAEGEKLLDEIVLLRERLEKAERGHAQNCECHDEYRAHSGTGVCRRVWLNETYPDRHDHPYLDPRCRHDEGKEDK